MALKSNVIVNGKEIKALIDTGAAGNIITNKLRKRLGIELLTGQVRSGQLVNLN